MTSENLIEVVVSKNGVPIRLTYQQWSHITENHDYMAGCLDLVLETLKVSSHLTHPTKHKIL
jgi:hypothetical protein